MRTVEADHWNVTRIQPFSRTHGAARVHLEVEIRAVFRVVAHAQLGAVGGKTVLLRFRIAVDGFDDHGHIRTVSWIVPEALDGIA